MTLARHSSEEAAPAIAFEGAERGRSDGWIHTASELDLVATIEARLAKFNIGDVDEISGAWAYRVREASAPARRRARCRNDELVRLPRRQRGGR